MESVRIRFMAEAGRLLVLEGLFFLLLSMYLLYLGRYLSHGLLVGVIALPQFVTGVYYHMLPGYSRRAAARAVTSLPPLISAASATLYLLGYKSTAYLLLSAFSALTAMIIYYSSRPLTGKMYHQKLIALSSYVSAAVVLVYATLRSNVSDLAVALAVTYAMPVGLIYAVNSASLTYTYRARPRVWCSIPILTLQIIGPIMLVVGESLLFYLSVAASFTLYLTMIRVENVPTWIRIAKGYRRPSKNVHLNLIYATLASLSFLPISLIVHVKSPTDSIHVLMFGFILLNILAHGPVLLPTILRVKARRKPMLPIVFLAVAAALLRTVDHTMWYRKMLSGALAIMALSLMIYTSVRFERAR